MAWTQTDIDRIKAAMASGVLTVKHGDTLSTFRSIADMERLLARMEAEVGGHSGNGKIFTEYCDGK